VNKQTIHIVLKSTNELGRIIAHSPYGATVLEQLQSYSWDLYSSMNCFMCQWQTK